MAKEGWMTTVSGNKFHIFDPKVEEVDINDITHCLSLLCRYNGHINHFYSVAQHSVLVSQICRPENALYGLLHDAAEAYCGDMITPLKKYVIEFQEIEKNIEAVIAKKFCLKWTDDIIEDVKNADAIMLATEVRDLIPNSKVNWPGIAKPLKDKIIPLYPFQAKILFELTFENLYHGRKTNRSKSVLI